MDMQLNLSRCKTWIWNAGAFMFFAGLAIWGIFYALAELGGSALCKTTPGLQLASPDGKKLVSSSMTDCGATTNWQSGISIEDRHYGSVYRGLFGFDGKPDEFTLRWLDDRTLEISGFPLKQMLWFKQDYNSGVKLVIKPSPDH